MYVPFPPLPLYVMYQLLIFEPPPKQVSVVHAVLPVFPILSVTLKALRILFGILYVASLILAKEGKK